MIDQTGGRLDFIPLSRIHYNPAINARRGAETDVTELAATLEGQDIGQPLLLRPAGGGNVFEPVDGGRRLRALKLLAEQGKLAADHPVPALIRELSDSDALSLSLATAITRLDLHPADEALSFTGLADKGMSDEEIAARFGIGLRRVRQRLAIGRLPEEIVAALRAGDIGLKDAQAFTLLASGEQALKLFRDDVRQDWEIRNEFSRARVSGNDGIARYVGREAYVAAGGAVDEDLFSNNVWFADGKLLENLFRQKLKDDEQAWLLDGWRFVIVEVDDSPHNHKTKDWAWLEPEGKRKLTAEEKDRLAKLKAAAKDIGQTFRKVDLDDATVGALREQLDEIEAEIKAVTSEVFTPEQKAQSGVTVRRSYGDIIVSLGVVKPARAGKQAKKSKQTAEGNTPDAPAVRKIEPEAEADFTAALSVEMASAMTHGMQAAIIADPSKSLLLAVAVMLRLGSFEKPEGFIVEAPSRRNAADTPIMPSNHLKFVTSGITKSDVPEIFGALSGSSDLDNLIATSVASLFRCTTENMDSLRPIIEAFDPDIAAIWQPTLEFFKRMPRDSLAAALSEAAVAGVTPSKKKKELVEMALREMAPHGWLPKPLRTPSYKGPGSNSWADRRAAEAAGIAELYKDEEAALAEEKPNDNV